MSNLFGRKRQLVKKPQRQTILHLEALEDRITPNNYTWNPADTNSPGAVIHDYDWNASCVVGTTTYYNWDFAGLRTNDIGYPGIGGSTSDAAQFLGEVNSHDCTLTSSTTIASLFMGRKQGTTNYSGNLDLQYDLLVKGGGFTMQSGIITLDTGTPIQHTLTIQDLPSGSNGGSWSGGTIQDAANCPGDVLISASSQNTKISNTTASTNSTTLKANMTIQGTSSFTATYALTNGMTANMELGSSNTITVGAYGLMTMTNQTTDGKSGTTDMQGGIYISGTNTNYAVVVSANGELDRGVSSDTK